MSASIPVNLRNDFYVMLLSNTGGLASENPVTFYEINYTHYQYPEIGTFNSTTINLANVSYTVLRWDETTPAGNSIKVQLRESDDGSSWDSWSSNFTSNLDNSIINFTKDYLQYRAFLETTNVNATPVLISVNISYLNASTNSTGGYLYNITIPTDSLGSQPLEVSILESLQGITGSNSTTITVWARANVSHFVARNYTQPNANYSTTVNFTRTDTAGFINGTIRVNISNIVTNVSSTTTCSAVSRCAASWRVPADLLYGNYSINITAHNESGYYHNISFGYLDFLEQRNTTGTINVLNKTIGDFQVGTD